MKQIAMVGMKTAMAMIISVKVIVMIMTLREINSHANLQWCLDIDTQVVPSVIKINEKCYCAAKLFSSHCPTLNFSLTGFTSFFFNYDARVHALLLALQTIQQLHVVFINTALVPGIVKLNILLLLLIKLKKIADQTIPKPRAAQVIKDLIFFFIFIYIRDQRFSAIRIRGLGTHKVSYHKIISELSCQNSSPKTLGIALQNISPEQFIPGFATFTLHTLLLSALCHKLCW